MLDDSGPHPLTKSFKLFLQNANIIFRHFTPNLEVLLSTFSHSGKSTICYTMQLIQIFCLTRLPEIHLVRMHPTNHMVTLAISPFIIFALVNLVQMESPQCKLYEMRAKTHPFIATNRYSF